MSFLQVSKGHGTGNDFVLFAHEDGVTFDEDLARRLADRHRGIGADGVIRVIRTAHLPQAPADTAETTWFMDYRNADGSLAEMCGNGVRVFAEYLRRWGLDAADDLQIGTRAGVKTVTRAGDEWRVGMGDVAVESGWAAVTIPPAHGAAAGLKINVGNPHTVVRVARREALDQADLHVAPLVDPAPDAGTNVELVVVEGDQVWMRVHERGVGETQSCGTGVVAAAVAARTWEGGTGPWHVHVPGGDLLVELDGNAATLTGPAVLVATAMVDTEAI